MYYLRSRPAAEPIKFTLDVESLLREEGSITVTAEMKADQEELNEEPTKKLKTESNGANSNGTAVETEKDAKEACPMRKRRKNSKGKWEYEEEECLACGS
jgi:hypothetical protein